jgi:hypothetical protein
MAESGKFSDIFFEAEPESGRAGRQQVAASAIQDHVQPSDPFVAGMTRGEMRLRVVRSLPRTHEDYIVKAIRKRCEQYLVTQSFGITVGELVSQVWFKLMAGASVGTDEEHN